MKKAMAAIAVTLLTAGVLVAQTMGGFLQRSLYVPTPHAIVFGSGASDDVFLSKGGANILLLGASDYLQFEGATADASETSLTVADPTADRTVTLADATGTVFLSSLATNAPDVANSVWGVSNGLSFEGATANAFELTLAPADVTADRSVTFADAAGTVFLSSLATNAPDVANSVWGVSNGLTMEGATADGFELTISPADVTADRTVTLADAGGTVVLSSLATNAPDAANSISGASNALVFEGATADAFEISVSPQDPTADSTVTVPNQTGSVNLGLTMDVILCGQLANTGTVYMSPVSGFASGALYVAGTTAADLSYAIGGTGCDAEDDATEGTADEILFANNAFAVQGLYCAVSSSGSNGVVLNLRSATADLAPDVTITIATATTTGAANTLSTTNVAAGATFALKAVTTENLSAEDAWCIAKIQIIP